MGLYGAIAYAVSRRTNEIGIWMAFGAKRGRIVWVVLREVLALSVVGIAVGLAGAWSAKSVIVSFLFGLKPADPVTILLATAVLTGALLLAGYAPAVRAAHFDPWLRCGTNSGRYVVSASSTVPMCADPS